MLPDLLCLDRLQYVSCAVRLPLCLIRSYALFNLSFSRFTYLFWFLFCFPFSPPLWQLCFVWLDDQSCGISHTQTSMQPYVYMCAMYFCILLTRYFAKSIETWQEYTNESGEPGFDVVVWMCMSVRCSVTPLKFFHWIWQLKNFPYLFIGSNSQTKNRTNARPHTLKPHLYFRLSLLCFLCLTAIHSNRNT